jgi:hypothetical protein
MNADSIDRLEETVYGNGRPGLTTRVSVLETKVDDIDEIKTRLSRVEKSIWIATGAIAVLEFILKQ